MAVSEMPQISQDPMYQHLRMDDTQSFNAMKEAGKTCELVCVNLRGLDMRGLDATGLDFTDSYMRNADLRGIDFREAILEGVNIRGAKISGTYFPADLAAEEITMSLEHGTRLRGCPVRKKILKDG